jgi:hypothetical protein
MQFASSRAAPATGWPLGTPPQGASVIHQCRTNDASTWQLVPGQPSDTKGKRLYKCKGCPVKMLR